MVSGLFLFIDVPMGVAGLDTRPPPEPFRAEMQQKTFASLLSGSARSQSAGLLITYEPADGADRRQAVGLSPALRQTCGPSNAEIDSEASSTVADHTRPCGEQEQSRHIVSTQYRQ